MSAPREKGKGEMGEEGKGYTARGRSRGHRLPVLVVAMAILVSSIGAALDAGTAVAAESTDATIEATSFRVGANQTGEGYAVCPANKRVVGGGVVESGPPHEVRVKASGPLDSTGYTSQTDDGDVATQWYAAVFNGYGHPVDFRVFAICSATSDATVEATAFRAGAGPSVGEGYAVCPSGKRALGGGVVQSGPTHLVGVKASGPLDSTGTTAGTDDGDIATQWYGAADNWDHTKRRDFKVFALCSARSAATIQATAFQIPRAEDFFYPPSKEAYAQCPTSQRALGGGVVESGEPHLVGVNASGPLDSTGFTSQTVDGDVASQWYGAAWNGDTSKARDFKVFAICE